MNKAYVYVVHTDSMDSIAVTNLAEKMAAGFIIVSAVPTRDAVVYCLRHKDDMDEFGMISESPDNEEHR